MDCIFVGGSPRSGTTLLNRLLCTHPSANGVLGEASYLSRLLETYVMGLESYEREAADYFGDKDFYTAFNQTIVGNLLANTLELQNKNSPIDLDTLILKEPQMTRMFPAIFELLGPTKFILISRDPRDTIASMVKVGEKMRLSGRQHFYQERDMVRMSNYFKQFYVPALNFQNTEFQQGLVKVRYEDLVTDPVAFVTLMQQRWGLHIEPKQVQSLQTLAKDKAADAWHTELMATEVSDSAVGNYVDCLTKDEVAVIERETADFMRHFGYDTTGVM